MRRTKNYTPAEKEQLLKEVKQTGNLSLVGKKHNVPVSTLHSWLGKAKHVPSEKKSLSLSTEVAAKNFDSTSKMILATLLIEKKYIACAKPQQFSPSKKKKK
jgi:transposase-like protein